MNIESNTVLNTTKKQDLKNSNSSLKENEKSFKDELGDITEDVVSEEVNNTCIISSEEAVNELSLAIKELTSNVHQTDDFSPQGLNSINNNAVIGNGKKEILDLVINDEMNVSAPQSKLQELKADISFAQQGGEAFSSFLGDSNLKESVEELNEDSEVLSTLAENLALVNKATMDISPIQEVGVVVDRTLDISTLNLSREDLNLILNLVNDKIYLNEISPKQDVKTTPVSEIMFNMLAESMKNGKAFRLNFDNDISVIIRVSKEGRISANFLPGSDIAENYLKNNMANLVQRFEAQGIEYDELTHQKQKRDNEQQNKKDKKNE